MGSASVIESKMSEVNELAARLGVERYIGSERMNPIEAVVAEWAVQAEGLDFMGQESLWLDAKNEIETVLSNMSLTHNSKYDLFLLGAAQSGAIPLQDVTSGLIDGWNKLLTIHSKTLQQMSQHDLKTIDRARDSALSKIPAYGTIEDKQTAITSAKASLLALEATLVSSSTKTEQSVLKGAIAQRMTTKSLLLAEAKSAKKQSLIPYGDYQQVEALLGSGSIFSDQVSAVGNFSHNPEIILEQMDRVLERATTILSREAGATTLAGGMFVSSDRQHRISQLGATTNKGDGIRISGNESAKYRGPSPQGTFSADTQGIQPFDTRNPNAHKVTNETHASNMHKAAGKLAAMHAKKSESLYSAPMGGWVNNNPGYATAGSVAGFAVLMWGLTKVINTRMARPKSRKTRPAVYDTGFTGTW
jgi:antitoxin component of RelBE/YafQ-DinJ toxin-antitoxin module